MKSKFLALKVTVISFTVLITLLCNQSIANVSIESLPSIRLVNLENKTSIATPLSFSVATPVYAKCPGGLGTIVINAQGGTPPYTYYIIPEEEWIAGHFLRDMLTKSDTSLLWNFQQNKNSKDVNAGTVNTPKYYWVAVRDAEKSSFLLYTGSNLLSWWKRVEVIDNKVPIVITPTPNQDLTTTCFQQPDGRINFNITGGTPKKYGYLIYLNGILKKTATSYDSGTNGLAVGAYEFTITDSIGCSLIKKFTIAQPKKLVYTFALSLKSCSQPINELWIASVDASTGSGSVDTWRWHYTTDATWKTNVSPWYALTTKATNLPVGNYYIEVEDGNGCRVVSEKVAVLEPRMIFNLDKINPACGKNDGQLWISSVDASSGSGSISSWRWHYTTDATWKTNVSPWMPLTTKVTNLPVGNYYIEMEDGIGCRKLANNSINLESNIPIIFVAGHTDTEKGSDTGQLKILSYDEKSGNGPVIYWKWRYTTDPNLTRDFSFWFDYQAVLSQFPAGKYYLQVKDALGCTSAFSEVIIDYASATSILEFPDSQYKVYLINENEMFFKFVSPKNVIAKIDLYDNCGRKISTIFNKQIEGGISYEADFRMNNLNSGLYIYHMVIGSNIYSGKIIYKK